MKATLALFSLAFLLAPYGRGQTSPTAASVGNSETAVELNPYEVRADRDNSYGAINSNSITAFNTALARLPISADIFDQAFMNDTASTSVEEMIQTFSAGAGYAASDPAASASNMQPLDRNGNAYTQLRGLSTPIMDRDGFMPAGSFNNPGSTGVGYTSNFDIERVEIINGPQALLYGAGGAGGVINVVSKQARIGQPEFGSAEFQVDQYGHRMGQFDFGASAGDVAVRVAVVNQTIGARRLFIGGPMEGYYVQLAAKVFGNTTIRVNAEQTTWNRIEGNGFTLLAPSTSNDARDNDTLQYLMASNQIQAAAGGAPSGAGVIDNGFLTWDNLQSMAGWWSSEQTVDTFTTLTADSQWTPWLSTQFAAGYNVYSDDRINANTFSFYAPNTSTNPYPGQWTMGMSGSNPLSDTEEPARTKAVRFSALATQDLFGGRAHSQSVVGADFVRTDGSQNAYDYFQADSNWNVVYNPAATAGNLENGRVLITKQYWNVSNGPIQYPLVAPGEARINLGGVNYIHQLMTEVNPALISPSDPAGTVASGSDDYVLQQIVSKGIFGANYTQWLDGRLDTLLGFRLAASSESTEQQSMPHYLNAASNTFNFNVGADYRLTNWLRPYFSVSDSFDPPPVQAADPYGAIPQTAHAYGEEVGLKMQNESGTLSGSLAVYHVAAQNSEYLITSTLTTDINPSGLNGRDGAPNNWINVGKTSEGVQVVVTASPTPAWRLRFSAAAVNGRIGSSTSYGQVYNDQFNENSQGQVTYADGNVVYVSPTFNSKQLTVSSATAGAVPLTVGMLGTPGNAYYAQPQIVNGQILSSSSGGQVLLAGTDPSNPSSGILTGRVGLPISNYQLNPALSNIVLPGTIVTSEQGDVTTGYPELSANVLAVYTVPSGWLKGLEAGGSAVLGWFNRAYYYYPQSVVPGAPRELFYLPTTVQFNPLLGYTRKFGRITWTSRLNITNVFNHYDVVILPNEVTGWTVPSGLNATFTAQPRAYVWTNTLSF